MSNRYSPNRRSLPPRQGSTSLGARLQAAKAWLARRNLKRDARWLLAIPPAFLLFFLLTYLVVARGIERPDQVILGAQGLEVLDRKGNVIFTFGDEPGSGRIVKLSDVSPDLVNATIAAEDADYWKNPGISLKGLVRATYENLAFWEHGGFFKGSGGSSITQQLAKNLYIKPEDRTKRSPLRKLKETVIALELNRRYSKEQVLEWYLSDLFYGNGAYGIESASYRYFNKAPGDLTLAESAFLAGIPRAPSRYDPVGNFELVKERQKQVLDLMAEHGFLTREQADRAAAEELALREGHDPNGRNAATSLAPHFAGYVRDLLPALLGKEKVRGQLRVVTTLDSDLQSQAQQVVKTNLDRFETQFGATNGALVAMDPRTGEVLAMVGSHDFDRDDISGQVNNALALNEPGSTMKAVTYLEAFMKGWAPATIVVDEPLRVVGGDADYVLANADKRYRGSVPVRTAFGSSLNVPAVKAIQYAGLGEVYSLAKRMGVTNLRDLSFYGPAFTLGGVDVSLLDMTYVYSVLAGQGEQSGIESVLGLPKGSRPLDPIAVLEVRTVDGKVLWKARPKHERIVPANASYLITNVLSDDRARVSMFGANSALNLPGRPSAAKSGSSDASRDAWTIGYTPQLVTGVWVGNADNRPMPGATSTNTAAVIWQSFMTAALRGQPVMEFKVPDGVDLIQVCATTGLPPTPGCPEVVTEVFLAGRGPKGGQQATTPLPQPTGSPATSPTPQRTATPRSSPTGSPAPTGTPRPSPTVVPSVAPTRTPAIAPTTPPLSTPTTVATAPAPVATATP